jgi:hypothetical protein
VSYFARRTAAASPLALCVAALLVLAAAPAQANGGGGGKGTTVTTTINLEGKILANACNDDVVNMSGDETTTITTTPAAHGYIVDSKIAAPNLQGDKFGPLPPYYHYSGADVERSHRYVATPPYPSTIRDYHLTKLVPWANAPTMWLMTVFKEVILYDGTPIVTLDALYLYCSQPCPE